MLHGQRVKLLHRRQRNLKQLLEAREAKVKARVVPKARVRRVVQRKRRKPNPKPQLLLRRMSSMTCLMLIPKLRLLQQRS